MKMVFVQYHENKLLNSDETSYIEVFRLQMILFSLVITKTCLYKVDPLKLHFYIVKLGFAWVYIIFHISAQNIDCGYSLEPPRRGGSNEYPTIYVLSRNMKNIGVFVSENFQFLEVKFSIYLNRSVFVMLFNK